jgi:hypothetical protein
MASDCEPPSPELARPLQNFRSFPRTILKVQGYSGSAARVDRFGTEIGNKQQKVSFIDRVKGESIKTVYIVEAAEYPAQTKPKSCCTCLLM